MNLFFAILAWSKFIVLVGAQAPQLVFSPAGCRVLAGAVSYVNHDGSQAEKVSGYIYNMGVRAKVPRDDSDGYDVFMCNQQSRWDLNHTETCNGKGLPDFSMHGSSCYKVVIAQKKFQQALEECKSLAVNGSAGRLAFVPSSDVQQYLEKRMKASEVDTALIGLRAEFRWTEDGETTGMKPIWKPEGVEDGSCVVIHRNEHTWMSQPCSIGAAYICEILF